jgi:ornithine carbamoyltransferase
VADLLGIADLGKEGLRAVLDLAAQLKADRRRRDDLAGRSIGLFFEKPSTRTRVSGEVAVVELGGHAVVLKQDEVGLGSRETVPDVARVLDRYLDLLAFRVFDHGNLLDLADHADAPVVNLLSDLEHPCQALADLLTIEAHRPVEGSVVAYVGDGNNVCHSLMVGTAMLGGRVHVVGPSGYEPQGQYVEMAKLLGGQVEVGTSLDLVDGADVVYTDVWASMGQESEAQSRAAVFAPYQVDEALFGRADQNAIFMHDLPAHRGEEVTDAVMDHVRSRVFDQAENRMHVFKALLIHLLG